MIIPSINSPDFETASRQIKKAEEFLPENDGWIHIDVEDGKFLPHTTWGNPEEFKALGTKLNVEVHLMVRNPESVMESWLMAGVDRVIVHLQSMENPAFVLETCKRYGARAMLSFDPSVPIDLGIPYLQSFKFFQVLSVFPGLSGQKFREDSLLKIRSLRERAPNSTIEVDGGVNEETGRLVKDAGADILVSGHYIFGSPDPRGAYERLNALYENSA